MGVMDKKKNKAQDGGGGGLGSLGGYSMPSGGGGATNQRLSSSNMPNNRGSGVSFGGVSSPIGTVYGARNIPVGRGSASFGVTPRGGGGLGGTFSMPFKKGGKVKKMAEGGSTASKRADGCATKGKTKGRLV